jgi:hypothetical protein
MFVGVPGTEFELPEGMLPPGSTCWRAIQLRHGDGWFIANLEFEDGASRGMHRALFAWDSDLVFAVEGPMEGKLRSLVYVAPPKGPGDHWECLTIARMYRGHDASSGGFEVIVFETENGDLFCGLDAVPISDTVDELTLIAEIMGPAVAK